MQLDFTSGIPMVPDPFPFRVLRVFPPQADGYRGDDGKATGNKKLQPRNNHSARLSGNAIKPPMGRLASINPGMTSSFSA